MKKIVFLIIMLLLSGCMSFKTSLSKQSFVDEVLKSLKGTAYVTDFTIYGRYFNISGEIENIKEDLSLVLKSADTLNEYELNISTVDNKTIFKTNELINEGINLENITEGEYVLLLKSGRDNPDYYTLKNKTEYDNLEYYTITKNTKNKKIDIKFDSFSSKTFLYLSCTEVLLPDDIYDIVIDPGHGGIDSGASKNGYYESNINLDYSKKLKKELEELGLKVKLTREDDIYVPNYGEGSRVSIPYLTKAKLMLSIHMNSATLNVGSGGVEIYVANNLDTTFASNLASNIVDLTSTRFSSNVSNKIDKGVYLRKLSQNDLDDIKEDANDKGYTPYEKATLDSVYYYIIRETGGIITDAYVDSRNASKPWNTYYNSNHGCESYLVELGYISSNTNLNILLNEKDNYIDAMVQSIREYLEI